MEWDITKKDTSSDFITYESDNGKYRCECRVDEYNWKIGRRLQEGSRMFVWGGDFPSFEEASEAVENGYFENIKDDKESCLRRIEKEDITDFQQTAIMIMENEGLLNEQELEVAKMLFGRDIFQVVDKMGLASSTDVEIINAKVRMFVRNMSDDDL